jgi:hypothetical protein
MSYCEERGIPYSELKSWADDDQHKLLAFRQWNADRCPGCGTFPNDWINDLGRLVDDPPFEAYAIACNGCRAIDMTQRDLPKDDPGYRVKLRTVSLHPDGGDDPQRD